jgi:DeoR/GlpR family transcriptional regulator of sugar metabolism
MSASESDAVADELRVSDRTIRSDLKAEENGVITQNMPKEPRKAAQLMAQV